MHVGRRYSVFQTLMWGSKYILFFIIWGAVPVVLYRFFGFDCMHIPWQPISLIGIAVAFYLGFKNNSSYERLWEARKIWGGIVNVSRTFAVTSREYITNDEAKNMLSENEIKNTHKSIIYRHIAWLHCMAIDLRKTKTWEHQNKKDDELREYFGTTFKEENFEILKNYIPEDEFKYIKSKTNRSAHILSLQTKVLAALKAKGNLEHFRHLELQGLIKEMIELQGKAERIKNFPFPRQYASVNLFFTVLFITLLPFGMLNVFSGLTESFWVWFSIPFSTMGSWVFWTMEMIGDYSENPFEGLYNDVPITNMARGIEIDMREMIDDEDIPQPTKADENWKILS